MTTAALVLGYLWLSLVLFCVLMVLILLAVSVVADWRSRSRPPSNVVVLPDRTNVRVLPRGEAS